MLWMVCLALWEVWVSPVISSANITKMASKWLGGPGEMGQNGRPGISGAAGKPGEDSMYCPCPARTASNSGGKNF